MKKYDLIIKNGTVVTPSGRGLKDIGILDGKISVIAEPGTINDAREIIDVTGKYVLPGLIEPHMHVKAPLGGITDIMDFDSAGKCGAFGGVTTYMDFSSTLPGDSLRESVDFRISEMEGLAKQDYSVHCKVVNLVRKESTSRLAAAEVAYDRALETNEGVEAAKAELDAAQAVVDGEIDARLNEIPEMVKSGVPTFKLFMTYRKANVMIDDVYMLKVMKAVKEAGGRCGFHAECNAIAEYLDELFRKQNTLGWNYFPKSKPRMCEIEAVNRVLYYAELLDAPVFFFHITTKEAVEAIRAAKKRGVDVIAETCIHYLTLTDDKNEGDDGILFMMSPPLRKQEDVDALWEGLMDGTLSQVTSDNCTFPRSMKEARLERVNGKIVPDYSKVISGVSGIEERFELLLNQVGKRNGFTLEKLTQLTSENPAKIFGCYPQKGCLEPGSDADIVVVDLEDKGWKLTLDNLHYPVDGAPGVEKGRGLEYAVYGDFESGGRTVHTIRRGEFLVKDGKYQGEDGLPEVSSGKFLARKLEDYGL